MTNRPLRHAPTLSFFAGLFVLALSLTGCERKERVMDVEAPGVRIKVDRDKDSGAVEVDVDRDKRK